MHCICLQRLSAPSLEDNEAASGEVMLNKWDPLLALVKCQWNGVKLWQSCPHQHEASIFLLRPFKAPSSEHLCLSWWRNPIRLLNCFKRQFQTRLPLLMTLSSKLTCREGRRWQLQDGNFAEGVFLVDSRSSENTGLKDRITAILSTDVEHTKEKCIASSNSVRANLLSSKHTDWVWTAVANLFTISINSHSCLRFTEDDEQRRELSAWNLFGMIFFPSLVIYLYKRQPITERHRWADETWRGTREEQQRKYRWA